MAANSNSTGDDELFSGINVTPLVDVVLVLLIIFLITAPTIYQAAIKVQLPQAKSGEETKTSPVNFTITKEGGLYWNEDQIDWNVLDQRLGALGDRAGQETAIISADAATPHGAVVRLMDALRTAGLLHFALNVESKTQPQRRRPGSKIDSDSDSSEVAPERAQRLPHRADRPG